MSKDSKILFFCTYLLCAIGIVMVYSTSAIYADYVYRNMYYFLIRDLAYLVIGSLGLFSVAAVPISFWKEHSRVLILLAILLLMMVFLPVIGKTAGGARRWIFLGPVNFQPAEYAKLAVCLYLSDYLSRKKRMINRGSITVFFPPLVLIGALSGLILLQPDLGSTAFIFILVCILFFWAGIRLRYVAIAACFFLPIFYFLVMRVPYRLSRVTAYLNPWDDPQGNGFQIIQSFIAYGTGGVSGVGLGQSLQKLFYLPSGHNDFIFSIISEELGLIGALGILALFGVIFVVGIRMANRASQSYEKLLIVALTLLIVLQALIHMLVATGLIPTKGLPLPFVSYGGTSLVFNLIAVGLLLGIDRQKGYGRRSK